MLSFKLLVGTENETRSPILKKICDHRGLFLFLRSLAHQDLLLLTLSGIRPGSQLAVWTFYTQDSLQRSLQIFAVCFVHAKSHYDGLFQICIPRLDSPQEVSHFHKVSGNWTLLCFC